VEGHPKFLTQLLKLHTLPNTRQSLVAIGGEPPRLLVEKKKTETTTAKHIMSTSPNECISGLVVRVSDRNFQVAGSNLTASHLQATLSKLLTYGMLRSTQPPTLRGTGNE